MIYINKFVLPLTLSIFITLFACNTKSEKKSTTKTIDSLISTKVYTLKKETPNIKWTAFKYTNKTGVSGTFDEVLFKPTVNKGTIKQLLQHSSFSINTEYVNSNNNLRDFFIYTYFFSKIEAEIIKGEFIEVNKSGGKINITFGHKSNLVPFTYTVSSNKIKINALLNLKLWNTEIGIKSLNNICKVQHTGKDGITKLWSEVKIITEINLK